MILDNHNQMEFNIFLKKSAKTDVDIDRGNVFAAKT